ncbi:hypothetical protein BB561_005158 [Smittium simulii]|uniref:Uncharacterized protein n=1 Tax=Smittium simulii TaxID=133385 RepID=A0A2T9YBR6_9FUNG|nr:hypothetical protein BB561_005158 [Smittium simulii]
MNRNLASNQHNSIKKQLEDGISVLMLDLHNPEKNSIKPIIDSLKLKNEIVDIVQSFSEKFAESFSSAKKTNEQAIQLCHTSCALLNAGKLELFLLDIKTFMDQNKNEVITIIFENYDNFSSDEIISRFIKVGLYDYLFDYKNYSQPKFYWPDLKTMIKDNNRLVLFSDKLKENTNDTLETSFNNTAETITECKLANSNTKLKLLNHFASKFINIDIVKIQVPETNKLIELNSRQSILTQVQKCENEYTDFLPNFIVVDFYDVGRLLETVSVLNNVTFKTSKDRNNTFPIISKIS